MLPLTYVKMCHPKDYCISKQDKPYSPLHLPHHPFLHLQSHSLLPVSLGPCQRHGWGSCRCRHTEKQTDCLELFLSITFFKVPLALQAYYSS